MALVGLAVAALPLATGSGGSERSWERGLGAGFCGPGRFHSPWDALKLSQFMASGMWPGGTALVGLAVAALPLATGPCVLWRAGLYDTASGT